MLFRSLICQHLNRSSPVLAILAVIYDGHVGWICYGLAIGQYLLIGLVASKDKALGVLQKFDEAVTRQRQEIEHEIQLMSSVREHAVEHSHLTNPPHEPSPPATGDADGGQPTGDRG